MKRDEETPVAPLRSAPDGERPWPLPLGARPLATTGATRPRKRAAPSRHYLYRYRSVVRLNNALPWNPWNPWNP